MLLRMLTAPLRTDDMAQAASRRASCAGDVLLADRGFCSYAHLALFIQAGMHAVLRAHQKQLVSFRIGRMHLPPSPPFPKLKGTAACRVRAGSNGSASSISKFNTSNPNRGRIG